MNYLKISIIFVNLVILVSCNNAKIVNPVPANDKIFGIWQYNNYPDSYIKISGNKYEEHLGEINSTIIADILWKDTAHYTIVIQKSTGAIASTVHPNDKFNIEIIELNQTRFRYRVSNLDIQPVIELTKINTDITNP